MPSKPCRQWGCPEIVSRGTSYCDTHKPEAWAGSGTTMDRYGLTSAQWAKLRKSILKRDRGLCVLCGRPGNEVDHVTPAAHGGGNEPSNLRTLCSPCHAKETKSIRRR